MGVSTVFSLTKIIEREGRSAAVKRVLKRGVLLFIIALIYSGGVTNPWPDMRLMGVLNRISLCYTFGGLLFIFCNVRVMMAVAAALLLGYWAMLALVPFPDVRPTPGGDAPVSLKTGFKDVSQLNMASTNLIRGSYIQGVNLTDYLDQKYLPARKYDGTYDPEGILSTLPAFVTGLLGISAPPVRARQPEGLVPYRCGRRQRDAGLALGHGNARHQKNLDVFLCAGSRRLQRDAARALLLDCGCAEKNGLVPAIRLDRHESNNLVPSEQFYRRIRETRAALGWRFGEGFF